MTRLGALALSMVLASLLVVLDTPPALACSCIETRIEDAITPATPAAFVGAAVSVVDRGRQEGFDRMPLLWTFEVDTVLGGEVAETVQVGSGYGSGDCGADFSRMGRVGIVAHRSGGELATSICGGIWDADLLLAQYGPGVPPDVIAAPETPQPATTGPPTWFYVVAAAAVVLAAAGIVLARRSRDDDYQDGWGRTDGD